MTRDIRHRVWTKTGGLTLRNLHLFTCLCLPALSSGRATPNYQHGFACLGTRECNHRLALQKFPHTPLTLPTPKMFLSLFITHQGNTRWIFLKPSNKKPAYPFLSCQTTPPWLDVCRTLTTGAVSHPRALGQREAARVPQWKNLLTQIHLLPLSPGTFPSYWTARWLPRKINPSRVQKENQDAVSKILPEGILLTAGLADLIHK